jgi:hypothetical protein
MIELCALTVPSLQMPPPLLPVGIAEPVNIRLVATVELRSVNAAPDLLKIPAPNPVTSDSGETYSQLPEMVVLVIVAEGLSL